MILFYLRLHFLFVMFLKNHNDGHMQKLKSLSDRLNYALDLLGTRKADLARAIDVKPAGYTIFV